MELGMIGLGRMGANMTERLVRGGHRVISYDRSAEAIQRVVDKGAVGAHSLADFVKQLTPPRVVWLMVPSGEVVDQTIEQLLKSKGASVTAFQMFVVGEGIEKKVEDYAAEVAAAAAAAKK